MRHRLGWRICLVAFLVVRTAVAQDIGSQKSAVTAQKSQVRTTSQPQVHRRVQRQVVAQRPPATPVPRSTTNVRLSYADALRLYQHQRHSRVWWHQYFTTIVLVAGGYYYWDASYWFPAWGYDPLYEYYDYDGPIYTYGNLLPDQVILNVQRALQQLGYYGGALTGSLESSTRAAVAAFQRDAGLFINGIVDGPTVDALGLE